ncbi:MAG: Gfo/Idh/MocA family oxidoreductase [Verrucomicrobiales bacterium]|nr:Gfo/Idh/MocA family oxidoreductase [Verrucomicrobiales bacterium]MCP5526381.1 Gfo/Idh/MocA family oxidoreductase [Verrucomicrobiales bacterium]
MNSLTRRSFLSRTSLAVGASVAFPYVGRVLGANERINIACIGAGGKGDSDSSDAGRLGGNIVALCDVDMNTLNKKGQQFPNAKKFQDYRKLLDQMGREIDAVTVSTPDHNHGGAAIRAMRMGKHCFCQKPLTQNVSEARMMRQLAKENKLATQMGNQGSAEPGLRRAVEVIQAGVIGKPKELHVWSNRPVWPQGLDRPPGEDPVPDTLNWDAWLGPAAWRPFKKGVYHTFNWRGWYDFGTGALGDMACHTVNMPFRALKLGYPDVVELEVASRIYPETFPQTSRIRFEFPEREGLPPLKFWWYDGNPGRELSPLRPPAEATREIVTMMGKLPGSGALVVGEKGKIFSPDDYGARFYVVMNGDDDYVDGNKHDACTAVPQSIPRSPGHMDEWFRMMKEGTPAFSNFDIAAYLTEIILLGCIALRVGEGYRMDWDGPNMRSTNLPQAAQFVKRNNRAGWEL